MTRLDDDRDDYRPRQLARDRCFDGLCGADDCERCRPGCSAAAPDPEDP